jgi:hypothetical protein
MGKSTKKKREQRKKRDNWENQELEDDKMSDAEEELLEQTSDETFHPPQLEQNPYHQIQYEQNPTVTHLSQRLAALIAIAFNGLVILRQRCLRTKGTNIPDPDDIQTRYDQIKADYKDYYTLAKEIVRKRSLETKMFRRVVKQRADSDQEEFLASTTYIQNEVVQLRLDQNVTTATIAVDRLVQQKSDKHVTITTMELGARSKAKPSYSSTPNSKINPTQGEETLTKTANEGTTCKLYDTYQNQLKTVMAYMGTSPDVRAVGFVDMFYRAEGLETALQNIIQTIRGHKGWLKKYPNEREDFLFETMKFQITQYLCACKVHFNCQFMFVGCHHQEPCICVLCDLFSNTLLF